MQDMVLMELERLTINDMKDFLQYSREYEDLATKTGRLFSYQMIYRKYFIGNYYSRLEPNFYNYGTRHTKMLEQE